MTKPIITREAEEDIDEILAFISLDNFDASVAFYERLVDQLGMLADNPKASRERPEISDGVRSFPFGSYVIFYRMWAGEVAVTRIVHGARDLDELLG